MTWNHRVIKHTKEDVTWYSVHECFYEKPSDKVPHSWTQDGVAPLGNTLKELKTELTRMLRALEQPILDEKTLLGGQKKSKKK